MNAAAADITYYNVYFSPGEDWIKIPLVNPTFWLNHIFFTTPYHWKNNTVRDIRILFDGNGYVANISMMKV